MMFGGGIGQAPGQEEVASVAVGDLEDRPFFSQRGVVLSQYHLHKYLSSLR